MTLLTVSRSAADRRPRTARLTALGAALLLTAGLGSTAGATPTRSHLPDRGTAARTVESDAEATTVLAVSIDGLNPNALTRLGRAGTPNLHRIMDEGASTLNARTEVELTVTLPNHTGMVTGRRITARTGGHGVIWNDDRKRPATVQAASGRPVESVFTVVNRAGGRPALFASKTKFLLWKRSWPLALKDTVIEEGNGVLVTELIADLAQERSFRMLHLSLPDVAGHKHGFMGPRYLAAVRRVDRLVGRVLRAVDRSPALSQDLALLVTADHGGKGARHSVATSVANYRIPFLVRGPGVPAGSDLYELNPTYADPGRRQPSYAAARQPVRNGMLANLSLDLLGLPPVPGSEHDAGQDLEVTPPVAP
ncbi:alkaline phosphatase family protein [Nocardioides houyundeii]|uniref:alkaline phosphatase family protein n=1 Tax=Nocardioides houyundeii TaxID=2045452 RepID=UPI0013156843|nr:alkaline phosphatase family protein [Nocardioides houyundeii]